MAQTYSLAARCGAEMIGTALVVAIGNAAVSNAVLPSSKGHGMGYGWVCAAYGTGFSLAFVSLVVQPAAGLSQSAARLLIAAVLTCISCPLQLPSVTVLPCCNLPAGRDQSCYQYYQPLSNATAWACGCHWHLAPLPSHT